MSLPRIRIARSAANDVSLMVQLLPFSREVALLAADPRRFVEDHRGELRFLAQLAQGQLRRLRGSATPAPGPAAAGDASRGGDAPVVAPVIPPAVASLVGRRTALLR